jgi:hypothetical protein
MNIPTFAIVLFLVLIEVNGIDRFDVSEKWPRCKDVFEDIQTQGNCSSSWAISVASSIRDRRCIKSGMKDQISAYDLISCCSDCQLDGKNGYDSFYSLISFLAVTEAITILHFNSSLIRESSPAESIIHTKAANLIRFHPIEKHMHRKVLNVLNLASRHTKQIVMKTTK